MQEQVQEPNADFAPNLVNTVCFLVQFIIQLITFGVNYQGPPFNAAIADTKALQRTFTWGSAAFVLLALDLIPYLTEAVSLVGCPLRLMPGFEFGLRYSDCDCDCLFVLDCVYTWAATHVCSGPGSIGGYCCECSMAFWLRASRACKIYIQFWALLEAVFLVATSCVHLGLYLQYFIRLVSVVGATVGIYHCLCTTPSTHASENFLLHNVLCLLGMSAL